MRKFLAVLMLSLPMWAHAGGFAGADLVFSSITPDGSNGSADVDALQFKFGSWINGENTLGWEFRAALGMSDDKAAGRKIEIDRYYGAYVRGQFPSSFPIRPYGILGLTRVETTETPGGSENYADLSLGLGAEATISKNLFVSLEYLRVVDHGGDEISNLGIGIGGRF